MMTEWHFGGICCCCSWLLAKIGYTCIRLVLYAYIQKQASKQSDFAHSQGCQDLFSIACMTDLHRFFSPLRRDISACISVTLSLQAMRLAISLKSLL